MIRGLTMVYVIRVAKWDLIKSTDSGDNVMGFSDVSLSCKFPFS